MRNLSSLANSAAAWCMRGQETQEEYLRRAGQIELGPNLRFLSRAQVIARFVSTVVVLVGLGVLLVAWSPPWAMVAVPLGFATYCASAYFVRFRPNHDHLRGQGFAIADHYQRSAQVNSLLLFGALSTALGRFVSTALVDGVRLITRRQLPHERLIMAMESTRRPPP